MVKRVITAVAVLLVLALPVVLFAGGAAEEDEVLIEYWTHWCANNEFYEPFWSELGERFNDERPEVNFRIAVNCVPYEGYEARYTSAFEARRGPQAYNGMTHVWAGEFDVAAPMPEDLADAIAEIMVPASEPYGMFEGRRYGIPIEGGNFMMMYINTDMFEEAGLDPNDPPRTYDEMLEYARQLTKYDDAGNITQAGFAIRFRGHPFGIADKAAPFFHAWGAEWMNWDERRATGYLDSPESIAALEFYAGLVQEHEVSSIELDNPAALFGQGQAAIMFRESWYEGWLNENAPEIGYKVYPLPGQHMESGFGNNFPWAFNVNKDATELEREWIWEFLRWYVNNPDVRREHYLGANFLPPWTDIVDEPEFRELAVYDAWQEMAQGRAAPTYYVPPAHETLTLIGDAILDAMYGRTDARTVLSTAAREIDGILQRY